MKDPTRLKELIQEKLDLARVLLDYHVEFMYDPMHAEEVQYKCPIHGKDNKPSARYYRVTNSGYCWVCMKRYDSISFTMDKEGIGFIQAINHLISRYGIDTSGVPDDPELKVSKPPEISEANIRIISVRNRIRELRGKVTFEKYKAICTAFYMILYDQFMGKDILEGAKKLETKLGSLGVI